MKVACKSRKRENPARRNKRKRLGAMREKNRVKTERDKERRERERKRNTTFEMRFRLRIVPSGMSAGISGKYFPLVLCVLWMKTALTLEKYCIRTPALYHMTFCTNVCIHRYT